MNILNQKGVAQIFLLVILLAGLAVGVYLVQQTQIFKPKAYYSNQAITSLTSQLLEAKKNQDINTMVTLASQRKEALLKEIETNPSSFLEQATLFNQREDFPEQAQPYIERRVEDRGGFLTSHSDNFDQKISEINYGLLTEQAQYEVHFAKDPPQPVTGIEISVDGIALEDHLALRSGDFIKTLPEENPSRPQTKFKIGVVLVTFTKMRPEEKADEALDPGIITDTLFGNTNSVRDYFLKASFNKLQLEGQIIGTFTIDQDTEDCSYLKRIKLATELEKRITKAVVDKYDSIVYVLPPLRSCGVDGEATLGGQPQYILYNLADQLRNTLWGLDMTKSRAWIYNPHYQPATYVHELGHLMGVAHANGLDCNQTPINFYSHCQSKEYWDWQDVMGSGVSDDFSPFHLNGPHKMHLGWIPQEHIKEVNESGVYSIKPLEKEVTEGFQLLVIRKPKDQDYYYLEYRQPIDYDEKMPELNFTGALLHIGNNWSYFPTHVVNINAPEYGIDLPGFSDGKVFIDSHNQIKIKQISHDENEVKLEITLGY